MAFKFKRIRKPEEKFPSNKPQIAKDGEEILSGFVDGMPAKRDEEFFMQEIRRLPGVGKTEFRATLGAARFMPGWLELDALVETQRGYRAFEIDDMSFVHLGQRESNETKIKDHRRIDGLKKKGINVRVIEHLDAADLETRAEAKKLIRKIGL